ncbi:serine hydrolase [Chamaesiphon sp.]|uniref:serine hydrolase n=1 Tax=Chamaesiphon sp. TaxID=2814140 RepID=UPI00359310BE
MASNRSSKIHPRRETIPEQVKIDSQEQLQPRSVSPFIYLVRLIICGFGASTIAGTTISIIYPPKQPIATTVELPLPPPTLIPLDRLKPTQSSQVLTERLQAITKKNSKLDSSYLFVEIERGEHSQLGSDRVLPAASTIKLPILIALFQDVDTHKVRLEEKLTIDKKSIAGGAGDLQAQKPGTQVSILVAATKMMTISDNTATNLLIARLGGKAALNQRFRNWGLTVTTINQQLPDLEGTNTTTAGELARSIMAIDRGKIVSDPARSQILSMMSNTSRNTMLPRGLGAGAKIAHKTGDIGSIIADVGLIELPTGKKYIAAVLVKRPYNDPAGPELVRQMSKVAYTYFQQPTP